MKRSILALGYALGLSGCALAGVYGPEAQERAQQSLVALGNSLDSAAAAYCNGVAAAEGARAQAYGSYNSAEAQIKRQLDDIQAAQRRAEWQHSFERLQAGELP